MSEIKDRYFAAQRALLAISSEKAQIRHREAIEKNKLEGLELEVDPDELAEVEKAWDEELAKRAAKKGKSPKKKSPKYFF